MHKILCGRRLYNVVFSTPRVGILQEDGGAVAGVFSTLTSIVLGKPRLAMHIAHLKTDKSANVLLLVEGF